MRLAHRIAGAVLLALALFLGAVAFRLSYYSSLGPGPGFFPLWLCGLLAILALAMIAQATLGGDGPLPVDFFPDRTGALRIAVAILALFATAATMTSSDSASALSFSTLCCSSPSAAAIPSRSSPGGDRQLRRVCALLARAQPAAAHRPVRLVSAR